PKTLKGEIGPAAQNVLKQVEGLKKEIPASWILWDERLSTAEVEKMLIQADLRREKRKHVRDQLAAQRILQSYLDHRSFHKEEGRETL
ncbi:Holliday junction resolvase RuvX, partial [Omnitrophica bacterium]|nr:Holliday junction resolvase RuvX [Candidatus Omnitrophota bacterium]